MNGFTICFEEARSIIRVSTKSKAVTLATRDFGRGTDFMCYDSIVKTAGGVTADVWSRGMAFSPDPGMCTGIYDPG